MVESLDLSAEIEWQVLGYLQPLLSRMIRVPGRIARLKGLDKVQIVESEVVEISPH